MPILINFKICDNSEDCSGIEVCPTGAFHWDEKNKAITVDNSRCIICGKCEKACPVDAIRVAKDKKEYKKIKKEIDNDTRKISDLFIDRYGAQPIHPAFLVPQEKFDVQILKSTKPAVVELFNKKSIMCLLNSIPVKNLFKDMDIKYRKIEVEDNYLLDKYKIEKLPSLLFFKDGKLVGKIEGYFDISSIEEIKNKTNKIISKIKK
jgi:NAD-dependent dihydropyrimidine dehydrogenase PreA subunit